MDVHETVVIIDAEGGVLIAPICFGEVGDVVLHVAMMSWLGCLKSCVKW